MDLVKINTSRRLVDNFLMQFDEDFFKHKRRYRYCSASSRKRQKQEEANSYCYCRLYESPIVDLRCDPCRFIVLDKIGRTKSSLSLLSSIVATLLIYVIILSPPTNILSSEPTLPVGGYQPKHINSGQFTISQLCAGKSLFPVTKRIEGAVLSSNADADTNCTITFRTKSIQQHFIIRFEELKLGCDDHLKMFDSDIDYGQPSIKDFSCRDSLANVPTMKTTGTFLTMRFSSDSKTKPGDGFRLIATAVFDVPMWECPPEYSLCQNQLCISRSLFCDDINHCIDNSDESSCSSRIGIGSSGISASGSGSILSGELALTSALGLLVVLVFIIFTCVILFIVAIYCRRENHYAQYQHHLQRTMGVPLQTSSSLMFANQQPQYHHIAHQQPIIVLHQSGLGIVSKTNGPQRS